MFSSSGGGKKPPQQQEMVQVGLPHRFGAAREKEHRSELAGIQISSNVSSSSRSKSPPSSSQKARTSDVGSTSRKSNSSLSSPPLKSYFNFLSTTNSDWNVEDPEGEDEYGYEDDDGDDFGLPSLSNMKRRSRRIAAATQSSGLASQSQPSLDTSLSFSNRRYLPTSSERRVATLERKRKEYLDGVRQAFERGGTNQNTTGRARGLDEAIWHQISIDVPRTNPHIELYGYEATQRSLERILYLWAIRHPASGYVQGINDLVTPFWQVFLGSYITDSNIESGMDPGQLPKAVLDAVEADSYWCLTKLLDGIQDHYIVAQPGIQRQVAALRDLTARIDEGLAKHLESENVEFIQFSFRWMNCLLMREISVKNTIRMWDTYLAEEQGFSEFHLYVCAAFLVKWSSKLVKMDFQEIMMFLQALPTRDWTEKDIELLLSEAFIWQSLFKNSAAHLRGGPSRAPATNLQL
ncbi:hypothetical protein ONZ43_g7226 [Nemania bipapillata]|uniref:Uncharacterized protein n=1 Tax=Nemania bipapillata TaxID=110536 RepID=A0ACC2HSK7_9PEZI|nr:hypothetical protein ONZ43_g7226 [Nemania bipapillata]